ncbi:carbon monoxide dehydrogenase [Spongiactinospora rosea]|uniref:Carbon monoxide dehydrogenase n=1 Tax=Spongiactinospora rosea TaxID=2248750 RepID=A0A366M1R3_9ACTN|nr:carbon monoxide dehydrogenase subunit G [Spongiactinospora rosea]RBQ19569.1 carbon monoxide dehydrogenase [Spongiactinospora rosea]
MKVVGSAVLGVDRPRVWSALRDPAVLVHAIPGCRRLEDLGDDSYRMTVAIGVAAIKGVYQGQVALSDLTEPESFTLRAGGQGEPGTVDATVQIRLDDAGDGGTRIEYDAEAVIGGMIGGVGQRLLASIAKRTATRFFTALETHLTTPIPVPSPAGILPVPVPSPAGAVAVPVPSPAGILPEDPATVQEPVTEGPRVYVRPTPPTRRPGAPDRSLIAAFGTGAGIALGSAVIGWLLGRTTRRR